MNTIAQTIAQQLGGNKFRAMTGATLVTSERALTVVLPRSARRINSIVIRLDETDTYSVQFNQRKNHGLDIVQRASFHGVYGDQLAQLFTEQTGLYTSL